MCDVAAIDEFQFQEWRSWTVSSDGGNWYVGSILKFDGCISIGNGPKNSGRRRQFLKRMVELARIPASITTWAANRGPFR